MGAYSVGDDAYGSFGRFGRADVKLGTVLKVTPSGQVTIDFNETFAGNGAKKTRRFTSDGREIGVSDHYQGHLIDRETYLRLFYKSQTQAAIDQAHAAIRKAPLRSKDDLDALIETLRDISSRLTSDAGAGA